MPGFIGCNPKSGDSRANDVMNEMAAYDLPEKKYA
uniref:Ribulose-1,5-bisphosphate carboxylase/oxygenase large subunit n=1 Tax=Peronospora matthiolae TaxID=2874970 RepID=A0AAV1TRJ9_9STRA